MGSSGTTAYGHSQLLFLREKGVLSRASSWGRSDDRRVAVWELGFLLKILCGYGGHPNKFRDGGQDGALVGNPTG